MNTRALFSCLAVLGATTFSYAGPTGLYVIPIADILGHREVAYAYGLSGTERHISSQYTHAHGLQVGLFNRGELGFDSDFQGTTTLNGKILLIDDAKEGKYALSIGATGYSGDRGAADWYIVGRKNFHSFRAHLGYWQNGDNLLIAGLDGPLYKDFVWQAETMIGASYITWLSVAAPIKQVPGLSLMVGVGIPKDRADGIQHSATLTYGFSF